ncbi:MAG: tetratricopeptide repeat protein [Candidatus Omnitrophica bacterium]|nr:tetratricopeptide repeat protein [Candidatus Omnitrophota bacterium]
MRIFLLSLLMLILFPSNGLPSSDNYLIEIGKVFLERGYYQEAELEFKKALAVNPSNEKAKIYLADIRRKKVNSTLDSLVPNEKERIAVPLKKDYFVLPPQPQYYDEEPLSEEPSAVTLKGEYQASLGIEGGDAFWKRANADLSEENWRILSEQAYNRRENTFDPAVYSRLKFEIDRPQDQGWGFHSNFDISPWSFISKSNKITVDGIVGDTFDIEYKYWSNTGYTLNETIYSNLNGDSLNLPELKVVDGKIPSVTITTTDGNIVTIPEVKLNRGVWPVRELWAEYKSNNTALKIFPVAMEDSAYSSDDPLSLTNKHTYWEESQWLINWQPGQYNSGFLDFSKGRWDDSIAYITRDSMGTRLTALRGFALNLNSEKSMLDLTVASPKELWQDYDSFNTFASALRGKYFWRDDLTLGFVYGSKLGYDDKALDTFNHFLGFDVNLDLGLNTEISLEAAASRTEQDRQSDYETEKRGNSFQISLVNASSEVSGKNYFGIIPGDEELFYKIRLALTHMDKGFESALASFRETRDDTFWSRHITFREPFNYYYAGLDKPSLSWDDIKTFRIGDGIDYGRDTINFRIETENLLDQNLDALFDVRNVHNVDGKYVENVTRLEVTHRPVDKLTTKLLGIYHDLPKTDAGIDPFVIDPQSGDSYQNSSIEDGKDPTLKTISLGANYDFFDWLDASFTWEHTNDCTLAYDNFPRGLFDSTPLFSTYSEYGKTYRKETFGLYDTGYFPVPPYPYFDIFKVGIGLRPKDNLEIYLDYTRNEYEWAQIIDDNMNHIGLEISYLPAKKLGLYWRYVYSRCKDISELNEGSRVEKREHHNFFSEVRVSLKEDSELVAQYGVGGVAGVAEPTYSPFGGGVATLDTQHIARFYYRKKF